MKQYTEEELKRMGDEAAGLHKEGGNCAQSVFLAYAEEAGLPRETARKIFQGFGGGLALGEVCGAFSGAAAALGLLSEPVKPGDLAAKAAFSARVKAMGEKFRAEAGALRCSELKPQDPDEQKKVCGNLIRLGVRLVAEELNGK